MSEFTDLGAVVAENLIAWCQRDDALVRCIAVKGVHRLKVTDVATATTLQKLLHDPDPDVRIDSAFALGELKIASSTNDLVDIITHDPVGEVRIQATKALGKIGVAHVIDPLIDCIRNDGYPELEAYGDESEANPCWEVQSQAIIALGEIASQSIVAPLIKFINESDYDDLQDLGFRTLAKVDSSSAHQYLHRQLSEGKRSARKRVIRALADTRNNEIPTGSLSKELVVDLNRSLDDEDPDIRLNAARALAHFAAPAATLALCRLLLDPEKSVRLRAGELLNQSEDEETVALLHDMLKISDSKLQQMIASILGQIGNIESGRRMSEILATSDDDLQLQLIKNIGLTASVDAVEALTGFLEEDTTDELILLVIVALGQVLSRHRQSADEDSIIAVRQGLSRFIFSSDRTISTAALEAFVSTHDNQAEILLGFVQMDLLRSASSEMGEVEPDTINLAGNDNRIPLADVTEAKKPEVQDHPQAASADTRNATGNDENLGLEKKVEAEGEELAEESPVEEEQIRLNELLNDLPNDGDPSSSTLASILANSEPQPATAEPAAIQAAGAGSAEWIPVHATRLLIDHADINDHVVDVLLTITESATKTLLREIIEVFSYADTPRVLPFLERCLKEDDTEIHLAALHTLKELAMPINDPQAIRRLLQAENPLVRQRSLALLAASDAEVTRQFLIDAFADEDRGVCITALASINKENFNEALRTSLFDLLMKSGGELTAPITDVFRRVEDSETIRWLLEKLEDDDLKDFHWIFINALTETYAPHQPSNG